MINYDYLYDKEYFSNYFDKDLFVEKSLSYSIYDNAFVVPYVNGRDKGIIGGIYTNEKEFVPTTASYGWYRGILEKNSVVSKKAINETVIYVGMINNVWGHAITDVLRFLWFLNSDDYKEKYSDCKLLYVSMENEGDGISKNLKKLLQIVGVDLNKLVKHSEITQYTKIIVPDECFFADKDILYFTKEYKEIIEKVHDYQKEHFVKIEKYKKLYFTYSGFSADKTFGEKKLEKFFKKQGYTIISPEKFSLEEQLNMLANCEHFASTIGSCAHNSVFLPKNATAIFIPRAFYLTEHQVVLDQVADINAYYIDASLSVLAHNEVPTNGPFFYYVSENLKKYFGVSEPNDAKYWRSQLKDMKSYLKFGMCLRNIEKRYPPPYYYQKFLYCMAKYSQARVTYRKILKKQLFLRKIFSYGPINSIKKFLSSKK